jgi:class 3 adenylate cyclase
MASTGAAASHGHHGDAERRQLTILFADLVGSTELSSQLDPEDFRDVLSAYRDACARVVARHEGYIGKFLGDGLLIYFGYPAAHEDDSRRAVRAALEIVAEVGRLGDHLRAEKGLAVTLQARVGVHTGLVIAGDLGSGDTREADSALGEPVNVASRIVDVAEPDSVVVSAAMKRLIEGYVVCPRARASRAEGRSGAG